TSSAGASSPAWLWSFDADARSGNAADLMKSNRREFVIGTIASTACGSLASCAGLPPAVEPIEPGPVDVGTSRDYPNDGINTRWAESHGFYVVRQAGRLFAVASICTHRRCLIKPRDRRGPLEFACPCHGSRFAGAGTVLKGPASVP